MGSTCRRDASLPRRLATSWGDGEPGGGLPVASATTTRANGVLAQDDVVMGLTAAAQPSRPRRGRREARSAPALAGAGCLLARGRCASRRGVRRRRVDRGLLEQLRVPCSSLAASTLAGAGRPGGERPRANRGPRPGSGLKRDRALSTGDSRSAPVTPGPAATIGRATRGQRRPLRRCCGWLRRRDGGSPRCAPGPSQGGHIPRPASPLRHRT